MIEKEYFVFLKDGTSYLVKNKELNIWKNQFQKGFRKEIVDIQTFNYV